jgi:hypothetical protein
MKDNNEVKSTTLKKFYGSNEICILIAKTGTGSLLNDVLKNLFIKNFNGRLAFGEIDISNVDNKNVDILYFLNSFSGIGLHLPKEILPGYYLFKNGKLLGYHPGTLDITKFDLEQKQTTLRAILNGLVVGLIENSKKGWETFFQTIYEAQAKKVFEFFNDRLNNKDETNSNKKQQFVFKDELSRAYSILGVKPDSTDDEIKTAWKSLQKEFHPDMSVNNKEKHTKIISEINNAYDLIKKSRSSGRMEQN